MSIAEQVRANLAANVLEMIVSEVKSFSADFSAVSHNWSDFSIRLQKRLDDSPMDTLTRYYVLTATNEQVEHITDLPARFVTEWGAMKQFERFTATNDVNGLRGAYHIGEEGIRVILFGGLGDDEGTEKANNLHVVMEIFISYFGHELHHTQWHSYFKQPTYATLSQFQRDELAYSFDIDANSPPLNGAGACIASILNGQYLQHGISHIRKDDFPVEGIIEKLETLHEDKIMTGDFIKYDGKRLDLTGEMFKNENGQYYHFPLINGAELMISAEDFEDDNYVGVILRKSICSEHDKYEADMSALAQAIAAVLMPGIELE